MGFNALQIEEGFYETAEGQRPFTARAIADCFAKAEPDDFLENQKSVLASLADYCPGEFLSGLWVMDSVHVRVPNGAHTQDPRVEGLRVGSVARQHGVAPAVGLGS